MSDEVKKRKMILEISPEFHYRLKSAALEHDVKMTNIIRRGVAAELDRMEESEGPR